MEETMHIYVCILVTITHVEENRNKRQRKLKGKSRLWQSKGTGNIGHTRDRTKTNKTNNKAQHNKEN